jgi:hypothetical protein
MNRKTILLLLASLIGGFSIQGFSQDIPKGISYQAVARDAQGKELANKNISVRFSLIKGPDGPVTWIETQNTTTDQFGLFNLTIGEGSPEAGSEVENFDEIDWGAAHYSLKVEVDLGYGFRHVGTMPFLSVPYALYAAKSGNNTGSDSDNQSLIFDPVNQHITIENGGGLVDLEKYKQTLDIDGRILSISDGNSVPIPTDADADSTNELQNLSIVNHTLSVSKGNTITLPSDIQDLVLNDSVLSLSNDPTPTIINLNSFDNQQLHVDAINNKLSIDNGNKIDIDASPSNEIQSLSLTNSVLTLSKGGGSVNIAPSIIGFRATRSNTDFFAGIPFILNYESTVNYGNTTPFDGSTGIFTAPESGIYSFYATFNCSGAQIIRLLKSGSSETLYGGSEQSFTGYVNLSFLQYLNAGDYVKIEVTSSFSKNCGAGVFSGFKVQ